MTLGSFFSGLFTGQGPIKAYLLDLLKTEVGTVSPPVGTEKQIGSVKLRAVSERWNIKLIAVREE